MRTRAFLAAILVALALPKVAAAQTESTNDRPLSQTPISVMPIVPDTTLKQFRDTSKPDSLANGMLIGAGIGAAVGMLVVPYAMCGSNDSECSTIVRAVVGLPIVAGGFGVGALVDSLNSRPSGVRFNVRW